MLGVPLAVVQKEVSDIIEHRLLVGHAIHNDLEVILGPRRFSHSTILDFVCRSGSISQSSEATHPRHSTLQGLSSPTERWFALAENAG